LFYGEACCTVWDGLCVWGGGVGELAPALCRVWMGGYDSICWGLSRLEIPLEDISSSDCPSLPLCYLVVCVGILMVDQPSANKLRRSISSPPHFPAHHPPLLHAYTFSRACSFVHARVPWTRSAPLLFACRQVTPLHPTALGNKRSCVHPTATWLLHQACTPPLHTLPCQHSLPLMACFPWIVLLACYTTHRMVCCADNLVPPRPPNHPHPTTHEYLELRECSCMQW
jgi:hypothetical protein